MRGAPLPRNQTPITDWAYFAFVDVLSNPDIRANLPAYANWPTFPQLWVEGELIGGCDIVCDMYESGELKTLIAETAAKHKEAEG